MMEQVFIIMKMGQPYNGSTAPYMIIHLVAQVQLLMGGALTLGQANTYELINTTIVNNDLGTAATRRGAGISWSSGNLTLINTIVANNSGASSPTNGDDILASGTGTMTITTSLVEDCDNCPVVPTFTSDPNLAAVAFCGTPNHAYFTPQAPSDAIGNGTAPGGSIPTDDNLPEYS